MVEITQSHWLAEGKSKEKSLRILPASEPILYTPLTTARVISQYSPAILALTPLYLDPSIPSGLLCFRGSSNFGIAEEMWRRNGVRNQKVNLRNRNQSSEQNWKRRRGCPLTYPHLCCLCDHLEI
jgi:hypothetical protein